MIFKTILAIPRKNNFKLLKWKVAVFLVVFLMFNYNDFLIKSLSDAKTWITDSVSRNDFGKTAF